MLENDGAGTNHATGVGMLRDYPWCHLGSGGTDGVIDGKCLIDGASLVFRLCPLLFADLGGPEKMEWTMALRSSPGTKSSSMSSFWPG